MRFDLAAMSARRNRRRRTVTLRDIAPPTTLATTLYREVYLPIIRHWQSALPAINDAYARALPDMVTDETPGDAQAAIDGAADGASRLYILLRGRLQLWADSVERWQRSRWRGAVLTATSVDLGEMIGASDVRQTVQAAVEWNAGLVRDVSDQIRQRIGNAVFTGLRNRTPARDVAREIRRATGLGRDRSLRIAADQLSKLSSALADERRRQAGLTLWKWRHSGKLHPRPEHVARDGRIYSDEPVPDGYQVDGATVHARPEDLPGELPYCGCRAQGVIDWNTLGDLAGVTSS